MSEFNEKASILQREISLYQRRNIESPSDVSQEITIENEWGASYLYAALLEQSNVEEYFSINRDKLNSIYNEFTKETGISCDMDGLFSRNWLRLVNDKVQIAGSIRSSVFNLEKVNGLDSEYNFLTEIQGKYKDKRIPESDFHQAVKDYQTQHNLTLNLKRAGETHWLEIKEGMATIASLIYYEPLLKYMNDFLFIKKIYDLKSNDAGRNIIITHEKLSEILLKHQTTFPLTPSLEAFIERKVFIKTDLNYILNFYSGEISFKGIVHDKAGAILWGKLLINDSFHDDTARIRFWYDRLIHRHGWCNVAKFFQPNIKTRFLDAALHILLTEEDISSGEDEYIKLKLDEGHRLSTLAYILSIKKNESKFPTGSDLFYLYDGLNDLDNSWQDQLMWNQDSRNSLTYFIHQVVRTDPGYKYERVFKLLEAGPVKPFLLWKAAFVIYYWQPEIIPFLLLNKSTASLAFNLFAKTKSSDGIFSNKPDIFNDLNENNFQLLCSFLVKSSEIDTVDKARIIFQCVLTATNEKFRIAGPGLDRQRKHKKENCNVLTSLQRIFESTTLHGNYYSGNRSVKHLWHPSLLKQLFEQVKNYTPVDYLRNNSITLSFASIDMLIWVLGLVNNSDNGDPESKNLSYNICRDFLTTYLDSMNCGFRKTWDYETGQLVDGVPIWSNQQPNLELIDWSYILLELEKQKLLEEFLNPSELKFKEAKDRFDNFNGFVANKVRTHLAILLIGYNDLYKEKTTLTAKNIPVDAVLNKLELKITFLITLYCKDEPDKARLDIFSLLRERTYWSTDREELLPVISSTINRFSNDNKSKIIKELIQTDQFVRAFKLLDYLVSEKDKEYLITHITENDIQQFFLTSYQNDAEYVLQKLVEEKKFEEKAKQALDIWEKRKISGLQHEKDQHSIMCFRMKLLLAYHELNEEKINLIPNPLLHDSIESNHFSPYNEKDFYKALIYLHRNEPQKAYDIFHSQLMTAKEDRPTLALNSFAAKIQCAEQTLIVVEKRKLFHEAIEEWKIFENKLSKDLDIEYIKDKIWYNKLHAYSGVKNDNDFDVEFNVLDKSFQLRPDFLELRIKNLMERKMQHHAEMILRDAEEYHRLNNDELPESILKLRSLTNTIETEKILQDQYRRIFSKPPEELIKILPGNMNRHTSLEEFLLSEIVGSASDMLKYINSISDIKKEDKFSDLMVLSLVSKFRNFGWHIGPDRGGYPASEKPNPGLIDYTIWSNKERIAICEALQLKGTNRAELQKHNFKIFNYDPIRKLFYVIAYFKGDNEKFNENWENYKTDLTNNIAFPSGFEITASGLEDISEKFGTSTVMTGKSYHGTGTHIYHVFININYLKPSLLKKGKNKKAPLVS